MELGRWLAAALAAALAAPAARKAREAALGPADLAWPRFRDGAEPALVALESAALAAAAARPRAGLAGGGEGGTEETRGLATTVLAVTLAAAAALASLVQILSLVRWRKTRGPGLRALGLWIAALRQDGLLVALEVVLAAIAIWRGEGSTREQFVKSPCADLPPAARSVPKGTKARIVMLAMGSRGDVQPFIALGKALESSGRVHVVIATMAKFQELVQRHGLEAADCGMLDLELHRPIWRTATHISELADVAQGRILDQYPRVANGFRKACQGCDLIVAMGVTSGFGLTLAEYYNVPCWVVALAPEQPTREFAPPNAPRSSLGILNLLRWYWHWARLGLAARRGLRGRGNPEQDFRTEVLGLDPLGGGKRLRQIQHVSKLCAFSPAFVPKPHDWPVNCIVTGFWFLDSGSEQDTISDADADADGDANEALHQRKAKHLVLAKLQRVLQQARGRIACINFGSMTKVARELGIVDAICKCFTEDFTVILIDPEAILPFDESPTDANDSTQFYVIREVAHESLFPSCDIVVHHGGAGTSARVVQCKCPALVVPIMLWTDQPLWADRLEALGVARHLERSEFDRAPDVFLARGRAAVSSLLSRACVDAVASLARQMQQEESNALAKSVDIILGSLPVVRSAESKGEK